MAHHLCRRCLWVSIYGTFVLNFCDFTRSSASKKSIVKGNFWGIPPINMLVFGAIVVVMAGGQYKINGTVIESPSDIVESIPPNTLLLVLACLALLILTIAVNLMANFVAPVYALTNLFPRHLNFRKAAWVSGTIGLIILPWNLYNNPIVIVYFLGGLGALLGPLFGVVMADYWLVRRGKVNVPELYTEDPKGAYFYKRGVNPKAIIAMLPAAGLAIAIAFIPPALAAAAPFAWFIGAGVAALTYFAVADKKQVHQDSPASRSPSPAPTDTEETHAHPCRKRQHHPVHDGLHRSAGSCRSGSRHRNHRHHASLRRRLLRRQLRKLPRRDRRHGCGGELSRTVRRGHPGRLRRARPRRLQELLDVPVVDITEAAASTAMFLGHKYSVVTTLDRAVPLIEDRLKLAGLEARCASVTASGMAVLELEEYPERAVEAIVSQAEQAVHNDKAEVIVLGCGGMAGLDEQIRQRTGVPPVVDGVAAAVTIAESLVRLGLSTSKVRTTPLRARRLS